VLLLLGMIAGFIFKFYFRFKKFFFFPSRQPMDDESRTKLAMACRKYLLVENANKYSV